MGPKELPAFTENIQWGGTINVLYCMQYKTSAHLSQWKITEDFDILDLFLYLNFQGVDFLETK